MIKKLLVFTLTYVFIFYEFTIINNNHFLNDLEIKKKNNEILYQANKIKSVNKLNTNPIYYTSSSYNEITWDRKYVGIEYLNINSSLGAGIKVAVLDTGISIDHPELKVEGGISFVEGVDSYDDDDGHGTSIAGVIAAKKDGKGYMGIAPNCKLYAVKVLDKTGTGKNKDIIKGIKWTIENKMDIIVMSFTSSIADPLILKEVNKAYEQGILLIASSGNSGKEVQYPAKFSSVISVGSVDKNNKAASFSNRGSDLDIVAPGVGIRTLSNNKNEYFIVEGTSISTAEVAGVAASLWSSNMLLSNKQIKALLYNNTIPYKNINEYGYGIVNGALPLCNINKDFKIYSKKTISKKIITSNNNGVEEPLLFKIKSDDEKIKQGQAFTIELGFYNKHNNITIQTYQEDKSDEYVHIKTFSNINEAKYGETLTYQCPTEVLKELTTYKVRILIDEYKWQDIADIQIINSNQNSMDNIMQYSNIKKGILYLFEVIYDLVKDINELELLAQN